MDQAAAEAILQRLPLITEQQARMLHAIWEGGDAAHPAARLAARQAALRRAARGARCTSRPTMRSAAGSATGPAAASGCPYEVYSSFLDQNRLEIRIAAAPPILDAILGSLVSDVFPTDELEELMAPWTLAMDATTATTWRDATDATATRPTPDAADPDRTRRHRP